MTTKHRWVSLCEKLAIAADLTEYQRLMTAYNESHRAYHTQQHLAECLSQLDRTMPTSHSINAPTEQALVEVALWYHDVIYDTSRADNELRSAQWASDFLSKAGASEAIGEAVHALIMATCHGQVPTDPLQQWIVDIDLSILGSEAPRFAEYSRQVRQEYHWVPLVTYKTKRIEILQQFLGQSRLYQTPQFYEAYELQARDNLSRAIEATQALQE